MKLRKEKWEKVLFGNAVECLEKHSKDPTKEGIEKFIGLENLNGENLKIEGYGLVSEGTTFSKMFRKGNVLFGKRRAYLKKIAIADFDGICSGDILVFRNRENVLIHELLPIYVSSHSFIEYAISTSAGSLSPRTRWKDLSNYQIPLPPLSEQKQIAALFQSIETAMEQVDGQEKKLKELRKSLINKLTKQNPEFGTLLSKSTCKEYSIGDLAIEVPDRTDNPQKSGIPKFIGLEDFESGELTIQKFSSTEKLVSAMKLCKQGDVLFARRNAYLKRASLTEFDAVCSGDVIVIRPNDKIILPKFLILVMNTDEFWEFAISNAAGTMSKRVKWRDLATYSFELPDIKIQAKILGVFYQLEATLSHLKQQKATLKLLKQNLLNEILG